MRRLMHAFMYDVFLEQTTQAARVCVWVCVLHHSNRTMVFVSLETRSYRVSLTFSPSGSNETVIRFTAFRLSNRKFLAIADIKPADRLSDPVCGKDILSIHTHKKFPLLFFLRSNGICDFITKFCTGDKSVRSVLWWAQHPSRITIQCGIAKIKGMRTQCHSSIVGWHYGGGATIHFGEK